VLDADHHADRHIADIAARTITLMAASKTFNLQGWAARSRWTTPASTPLVAAAGIHPRDRDGYRASRLSR
jgi:hypothetical protein